MPQSISGSFLKKIPPLSKVFGTHNKFLVTTFALARATSIKQKEEFAFFILRWARAESCELLRVSLIRGCELTVVPRRVRLAAEQRGCS
jgi:hypothetical protein